MGGGWTTLSQTRGRDIRLLNTTPKKLEASGVLMKVTDKCRYTKVLSKTSTRPEIRTDTSKRTKTNEP